jgi:hypothetical protein
MLESGARLALWSFCLFLSSRFFFILFNVNNAVKKEAAPPRISIRSIVWSTVPLPFPP